MWRTSSKQLISASTTTTSTTSSSSSALLHSRSLCAVSRLAPHPPDLLKWVRREGGFVHQAVTIANAPPYGLGLVAAHQISRGSDLIALPSHVPLKFDDGSSSVLDSLAQLVPEELWAMRLGLRLLQERAKTGSFWWPYISNLPETYSVPIFFQGEDIKNLQYAPLLHQVNKRCRFLLEFEKEVKDALANLKPADHPFGGQDVDASSLGWAMTAVSSRAFRLHRGKPSDKALNDMPMMLPLIDMCNHSFNANAKIIQESDAENAKMIVKVVAEKDININEPLELNYGCLSNDFFLLDYGFVVPKNPYDCIELRYDAALLDAVSTAAGFSSPSFSSPAPWQQEILTQLKFDGEAPDLKVAIGGPGLVEGRFLAAIRVLHADNEETVRKHDLTTLQSLSEAPLGTQNEAAALRTIVGLCATVLQHFPTKITEDDSLLKQEGLSRSTELAAQFRLQKKTLIVNVMMDLMSKLRDLSKPKSQESPTAATQI